MNKLIIAGNGFDLAHGLPTSYNHFMDAFWRDLKYNIEDDLVKKVIYFNTNYKDFFEVDAISHLSSFRANVDKYISIKKYKSRSFALNNIEFYDEGRKRKLFYYKNQFFKRLNEIQSIENWVDVENEYYQALKNICKNEKLTTRQKKEKAIILHKEFDEVKKLFERYLEKHVIETYDFSNPQLDYYYIYCGAREQIDNIVDYISAKEGFTFYIVNFNYTPTLQLFYSADNEYVNHIHGELNKNIVFGFGDEMDDDYKLIENMDDNEYLRYFKSFQYSQNSNYKDVLRYIDSEKFQVIIMGHSCGLSDRVLLNTIFEHENCRSIKVYYHQRKDATDNYTEIVQNISRHFNDKQLMRTKIVEKTLCEPMPQMQLPKKKSTSK